MFPHLNQYEVRNVPKITQGYRWRLYEDLNSFNYAVRILKWFERRSGLAINNDKTKVMTLGASRGRSIPWQGKYGLEWTTTFEILGIIYNMELMTEITKHNIYRKVGEVKKLISI